MKRVDTLLERKVASVWHSFAAFFLDFPRFRASCFFRASIGVCQSLKVKGRREISRKLPSTFATTLVFFSRVCLSAFFFPRQFSPFFILFPSLFLKEEERKKALKQRRNLLKESVTSYFIWQECSNNNPLFWISLYEDRPLLTTSWVQKDMHAYIEAIYACFIIISSYFEEDLLKRKSQKGIFSVTLWVLEILDPCQYFEWVEEPLIYYCVMDSLLESAAAIAAVVTRDEQLLLNKFTQPPPLLTADAESEAPPSAATAAYHQEFPRPSHSTSASSSAVAGGQKSRPLISPVTVTPPLWEKRRWKRKKSGHHHNNIHILRITHTSKLPWRIFNPLHLHLPFPSSAAVCGPRDIIISLILINFTSIFCHPKQNERIVGSSPLPTGLHTALQIDIYLLDC